jgi:hypothetical protein
MALLVIFGAGAARATMTIDGEPLDIHLGDQGNVQVLQLGQSSYSFYPSDETFANAGFLVALPGATTVFGPPMNVFGENDVNYTAGPQSPVTGSGTSGNPYTQVTVYDAGSTAEVTQTTTYVQGNRSFKQRFEVKNTSGGTLQYRASTGADLYLEGSDSGVGFFSAGPPKFVGGLSEATGRAGGLREVAGFPWSAYQEANYRQIWDNIFGAGLENSIVASSIDNGIGVQWDNHLSSGLLNNETATYEVEWQFGLGGLTASPPSAQLGTGSFHQVTLTATNANGGLIDNGTIRYEISGANPQSGTEKTGGNGKAQVGWVGNNAGTDTLTAYLDEDGDGTHDPGEPEASADAVFVDPPTNTPPPPPIPNMPPLELQGKPILQKGSTTLVVVVPSAGRLTVQQANGGGNNGGGKKSSVSLSAASAEISAVKGKKGKKGKGKHRRLSLIRKVVKRPKHAGPVRIKIRPTKKGKKVLAKRGKLTVKVQVSFTPSGSKDTQTIVRKVTIKKNVGKKGKKKGGHHKGGRGRGKSKR